MLVRGIHAFLSHSMPDRTRRSFNVSCSCPRLSSTLPPLNLRSDRRKRRTVTAGEIEFAVRLLKSREDSRARSPSTGAVQAVSMLYRPTPLNGCQCPISKVGVDEQDVRMSPRYGCGSQHTSKGAQQHHRKSLVCWVAFASSLSRKRQGCSGSFQALRDYIKRFAVVYAHRHGHSTTSHPLPVRIHFRMGTFSLIPASSLLSRLQSPTTRVLCRSPQRRKRRERPTGSSPPPRPTPPAPYKRPPAVGCTSTCACTLVAGRFST